MRQGAIVFFIDQNGVRLHCAEMGSGPTVVLCHGLVFGSMASWYFSVAAKLAQRYRVVMFDKRGHGKSDMPASGYDLPTLVDDLSAVIDHTVLRDEPVTLIGHSYGALVALHYALQRKRRIRDLILIDAPLPASRYVFPSLSGITSKEILHAHLPALLHGCVPTHSRRLARVKERLEFLLINSSLRADVAAAGDIADSELRNLATHTLCIYGRQSDCADAGKRLAENLPHAQLAWIDSGHYILEEAPQKLLGIIEAYLLQRERPVERRKTVVNGSYAIERRREIRKESSSGYQ
jgi:pimeloyl-ACP methyl ester carboxylesterase